MADLDNRVFACMMGIENGDVTTETVFYYKQYGTIVHAAYRGGRVQYGELVGMAEGQEVQGIFHYCDPEANWHAGTCTFRLAQSQLHGTWLQNGEAAAQQVVLEELHMCP